MFCIASRNCRGMDASASATWRSKVARSTGGLLALARSLAGDDGAVEIAVVHHGAEIAQRSRPADAPAMKDQRVGCAGPSGFRHRLAQLLFHDLRIVGLRDAD